MYLRQIVSIVDQGTELFRVGGPSEFSIILGVLPSRTATAELVVPGQGVSRSISQATGYSSRLTKINADNLTFDLFLTTS